MREARSAPVMHVVKRRAVMTLEEALDAEEAFITSATSLVMPVTTIDGHTIHNGAPGPTALRLREIYIDYARKGGVLG